MKKSSSLSSLSEKGRRIRDALACGQIIVDAFKLATVLLSKEPDLYAYMQDNNYLRPVELREGEEEQQTKSPRKAFKMENR